MASKYEALKAEALGSSLSFEYDSQTYKIDEVWDWQCLDYFMDGRKTAAAKHLLGSAQYQKFRKKHSTTEQLDELIEASLQSCGISKDSFYGLIHILSDEKLLPLFEVDLLWKGIELKDFFTSDLTLRTLTTLFETLAPDSATMVAYIGDSARWSLQEYMLADMMDMLMNIFRMSMINAQLNGYKQTYKTAQPVYIRPGNKHLEAEAKKKEFNPTSDLKALINPGRLIAVTSLHREEDGFTPFLYDPEEERKSVKRSKAE